MNNNPELNLARKWRPSTFKDIIGQDLTVRILKNSLYRQQFFPVYLLAGQRGCGKTTTGRVFAAAINCEKLEDFAKDPQSVELPCLSCGSCTAMIAGRHPDFIEIDAASHTGVDHARQIIEATSFLPHMSRKKIYLIDEAHMLSKAAFNAFLKILEEPPMTALFLMATTDVHKIIDTVRSRCCQLFFDPVAPVTLTSYLASICDREAIAYTSEGLTLVARHAQGSVRDALNIIERIRLAYDAVDRANVANSLGLFDDSLFIDLLEKIAASDTQAVLTMTQAIGSQPHAGAALVQGLANYMQASLLAHYGAAPQDALYTERLQLLVKNMTPKRLIACMDMLYAMEQQIIKSTSQQALLELLLIKMSNPGMVTLPVAPAIPSVRSAPVSEKIGSGVHPVSRPVEAVAHRAAEPAGSSEWSQFVAAITAGSDQLLASVIKQGTCVQQDVVNNRWRIELPKDLAFFEDMLQTTAPVWQAVLDTITQKKITLEFCFVGTASAAASKPAPVVKKIIIERPVAARNTLDVSDATKWEKTHTLLQIFPGTVTEAQEK